MRNVLFFVQKNVTHAIELYEQAASQGSFRALNGLGASRPVPSLTPPSPLTLTTPSPPS